jgi:hypothetical protein
VNLIAFLVVFGVCAVVAVGIIGGLILLLLNRIKTKTGEALQSLFPSAGGWVPNSAPIPRQDYCRAEFLSPAETEFFRCIVQIYGSMAIVSPKVRLLDLAKPNEALGRRESKVALNRVSAKHVDFALLRPDDLSVFGVVELDDRSHQRKSRVERDDFVDDVLRQAGIPVCRVKFRWRYDPDVLCRQLNEAFAPSLPEISGA